MAEEGLEVIQSMIEISADRLERLRTQCATSAELTQQETRSLETKLIRMFCKLLLTRQQLSEIPTSNDDLRQWLRVVGLSKRSIIALIQNVTTLEALLKMNEDEISRIVSNDQVIPNEESRRLLCAINNLKHFQHCLTTGDEPSDLFLDSWDRKNNCRPKGNAYPASVNEQNGSPESPLPTIPSRNLTNLTTSSSKCLSSKRIVNNIMSSDKFSEITSTLMSPSPPQSPSIINSSSQIESDWNLMHKRKPGIHRINNNHLKSNICDSTGHQLNNNTEIDTDASNEAKVDGMIKSKSNDSQISVNINGHNKSWNKAEIDEIIVPSQHFRTKLIEDENSQVTAIINDTNVPPRSPLTPIRGMHHIIQHRFSKKFKINSTCDLCNKRIGEFFGFKCTECRYRCHKDCKPNVPPSCGLPKELVEEFVKTLHSESNMPNASPNLTRIPQIKSKKGELRPRPPIHSTPFHGADSSSAGSSCNSSSPSSPALLTIPPHTPANKSQFSFPEVSSNSSSSSHPTHNHLPNTIIEDAELETNPQITFDGHYQKNNDLYMKENNHHRISINDNLLSSNYAENFFDTNGKL